VGINVQLRDERHATVLTLDEALVGVPPPAPDWPVWDLALVPLERRPDFPLLRGVDPYGNTIFNGWQANLLLEELDALEASGLSPVQLSLVRGVRVLLAFQSQTQHHYLWFIGD